MGLNTTRSDTIKYTRLAAKGGDVEKQLDMGIYSITGTNGVQQNFMEANKWVAMAAEKNDPNAQFNLGLSYEAGLGVEKDIKRAIYWYEKSAAQGHIIACHNLGVIFQFGSDDERAFINYEKAIEYYTKAAETDFPPSQCNLGFMYLVGLGVEMDAAKAVSLFIPAAEQNIPQALFHLGWCLDNGLGIEENLERAFECYQLSAKDGFPIAQHNLSLMYLDGRGTEKNDELANYWLNVAANCGLASSKKLLAILAKAKRFPFASQNKQSH